MNGTTPARESGRLHEIDGIRGWAALSVLLYHFGIEQFVHLWPEAGGFLPRMLAHGPLAVAVFFVLSGDALASAYFSGGLKSLDSMVVKRYFRLTLPVFASCLVVWVLMRMDWVFHVPASRVLNDPHWLGAFLDFDPTVLSLLYDSLYRVYTNPQRDTSYNPFLWTMSIELIGSMLVFLYLYAHERLRRPKLVLACLVVFTLALRSFYGLFFVGVYFCLLRQDGFFTRLRASRGWAIGAWALLIACAAVDAGNLSGVFNLGPQVNLILGPLLVLAFYASTAFVNFFSNRFSTYLGDISFSLYLIHFAVLVSLNAWLVLQVGTASGGLSVQAMLGIALTSAFVSIGAATILWRGEKIGLRYLGLLPGFLFKPGTHRTAA